MALYQLLTRAGIGPHRLKYEFSVHTESAQFYNWVPGELRVIEFAGLQGGADNRAASGKQYTMQVPAPYDCLISQLWSEYLLGLQDESHEILRRQAYAVKVLNLFAEELLGFQQSPVTFRSRVLNPILQRYIEGVADNYLSCVESALTRGEPRKATFADAVRFYLSEDPVDTRWIPSLRRNLVYIPEARWYLALVEDVPDEGSGGKYYFQLQTDHDIIMESLNKGTRPVNPNSPIMFLSHVEIQIIGNEGLTNWFKPELKLVVSGLHLISPPPIPIDAIAAGLAIRGAKKGIGQWRRQRLINTTLLE